ncbi:MAG TPA: hypothetical protein VNE63_09450 [Candidatus Acidoferrales bacterium]|nr:hypothetical protein [Candidatus Acidoferrales bacterium]
MLSEKRSLQTHESKSDPEALLARKGADKEAKLSYSGNLLVENGNGLIVSSQVWEATGTAERDAAMTLLQDVPGRKRVTVGGDKGFDTAEFVRECRNLRVTPHVAQNRARRLAARSARPLATPCSNGIQDDGVNSSVPLTLIRSYCTTLRKTIMKQAI